MKIGKYWKLVIAAVFAGAQALNVAVDDGLLGSSETVTVVLAVLTALGVYAAPNKDDDSTDTV